jgi:hypothetical protein
MPVCTMACGKTAVIASGETLQAIEEGDRPVLGAAVFELVDDARPEFGALVPFEPWPREFLAAAGAHAGRDVPRFVTHRPVVADPDPRRVEDDRRTDRFRRSCRPGGDLVRHRVAHRADRVRRDVDRVEFARRADHLAGARAAGVHREDPVVKPGKAAPASGDRPRVETGLWSRGTAGSIRPVPVITVFLPQPFRRSPGPSPARRRSLSASRPRSARAFRSSSRPSRSRAVLGPAPASSRSSTASGM